jgi:hypothetical protein
VSEAFVAVTIHVPAALEFKVEPETVQGPESTTNEFDPLPLPPDVVKDRDVPNVPVTEVITKVVVCAPLLNVTAVWLEEIEP